MKRSNWLLGKKRWLCFCYNCGIHNTSCLCGRIEEIAGMAVRGTVSIHTLEMALDLDFNQEMEMMRQEREDMREIAYKLDTPYVAG